MYLAVTHPNEGGLMMLNRIRNIVRKDPLSIKLPRHIALTLDGIQKWALKNNRSYEDTYKKSFAIIKNMIEKTTAKI